MSYNPIVKLTAKSGTVKKISASKVTLDMYSDAIWHDTNATTVSSVPTTLSVANLEWLCWERNQDIEVEFEPDSTYPNGQGFASVLVNGEVTVAAVSGTVYIIRASFINQADDKASIYANGNRVAASVGDKLYLGDAILCSNSGPKIKIEVKANSQPNYVAFAVIQLATAKM